MGPEPTTDRFTALLWGPNDKIVPGAALCSQADLPFNGLSPYGNNFLSRLEGVEADSPILRNVTLIDTPGILSGQKQRSRNYDYESVMKWFGERADVSFAFTADDTLLSFAKLLLITSFLLLVSFTTLRLLYTSKVGHYHV